MHPQNPHAPCTENASNGSSIPSILTNLIDPVKIHPPTIPIKIDHYGLDASQPAVILTNPASTPLLSELTHSTWSMTMVRMNTVSPPHAAAMVVFMHTSWITTELSPVAPRADPPLNPYQPNQRMKVPSTTRPTLCGLNSSLSVLGSNLPILGPRNIAPYSPLNPPTMCTMPDPAKSVKPSALTHPPDAQVQCTTTG